jgi:hypothetical protein
VIFTRDYVAQLTTCRVGFVRCSILVLIAIVLTTQSLPAQTVRYPDTVYTDGSNRIYVFKELQLTILSVYRGFDYVFTPRNVPAFASVARKRSFRFMINASFFDNDRLDAQHAGWLRILGASHAPVRDDRQLTHIIRYDTLSGKTEIVDWQNFKPSTSNHTIEFQTGPLVISRNVVTTNLINNSINGSGKYTRTLIAVGGTNELWFITVRRPVSLDSLGRFLLTLSIFQNKTIDVVNLDGGPSVAFYSRAFPELNYNVEDRLPLLLGIR